MSGRLDFQALLREAEVRPWAAAELELPSLPPDGQRLLRELLASRPESQAAIFRRERFAADVEVASYPAASGPWYATRGIALLVWPGDLTVDGDLLDDDFQLRPALVVRGDLTVRGWLRGGLPAFVGGSVRASGFLVGHYDDGALFVGGDLVAAGWIHRRAPYPDRPDVPPQQVAGRVQARRFDAREAGEDALRASFVPEVLVAEDGAAFLDERAVLARSRAGQAVWR